MSKTVKRMERIMSLDIIRIIAICAVVMIHASAACVAQNSPKSLSFVIGNLFDSISRLGVPLFFMISGALMLNETKEISFERIVKKYVLNSLFLLFLWSFLYAILEELLVPLLEGKKILILKFLKAVVWGHYHLWFLFAIIGLYLITPILRLFVKKENKKYIEWFVLLGIVFEFFPKLMSNYCAYVEEFFDKFCMGFVSQYVIYYIIGWYVTQVGVPKSFRKMLYILGAFGLIITIVGTQILCLAKGKYTEDSSMYSNFSLNILLYSCAVFVFLYYSFFNRRSSGIVTYFSELTFGIYLIHPAIQSVVGKLLTVDSAAIFISVSFFTSIIVSAIITAIMRKIPIVKTFVKG